MPRGCDRSDEGSALLLVLVLLTILSLALGAVFANAGANLTMSTAVTGRDNKVYAADGGVEYVIQKVRGDASLCPMNMTLPNFVNRRTVTVQCTPTVGPATSVSPWALVTTDTQDPSLSTQGGSPQTIDGPVYVSGGTNLLSPLTINGDFLWNQTGTCPSIDNLTVAPPSVTACTTMPIPDPKPSLPDAPPSVQQSTKPTYVYNNPNFGNQPCGIWQPGTYTGISLGADNYFASGVYYFKDTSITLDGQTAVGGQPGPDYQQAPVLKPTACSSVTDQTAGLPDGSGYGVEFILGGTSTITVQDSESPDRTAQLELFARVPQTRSDGTPGISIRTVRPSATGWEATTNSYPLVLSSKGDDPRLAVHGYVYVPEGSVSVDADGNVPLAGGLFCWQATLKSSGGVQISAQSGAQSRYVVITSTAKGDPGQREIVSTAVVAIRNDAARTVDVQSWFTSNP